MNLEDIAVRLDALSVELDIPELYALSEEITTYFGDMDVLQDRLDWANEEIRRLKDPRERDRAEAEARWRSEAQLRAYNNYNVGTFGTSSSSSPAIYINGV